MQTHLKPLKEILGPSRSPWDVFSMLDWLHDHAEAAYLHASGDPLTPVNLLHPEYGLTVIRRDGVNRTFDDQLFGILEDAVRFVAEGVCGQRCSRMHGNCPALCQQPLGHTGAHNCVTPY